MSEPLPFPSNLNAACHAFIAELESKGSASPLLLVSKDAATDTSSPLVFAGIPVPDPSATTRAMIVRLAELYGTELAYRGYTGTDKRLELENAHILLETIRCLFGRYYACDPTFIHTMPRPPKAETLFMIMFFLPSLERARIRGVGEDYRNKRVAIYAGETAEYLEAQRVLRDKRQAEAEAERTNKSDHRRKIMGHAMKKIKEAPKDMASLESAWGGEVVRKCGAIAPRQTPAVFDSDSDDD